MPQDVSGETEIRKDQRLDAEIDRMVRRQFFTLAPQKIPERGNPESRPNLATLIISLHDRKNGSWVGKA